MTLSLFTWAIVLLVSDLPNAIWQAALGEPPAWLFWAKIGLLLVLILITGLLGALFAKCMLGSKSIAVPWFVHLFQNTVIYAFWAIASVT